ncbi:MAG: hypothetical protein KBH33_13800 [Alicycliphilus sp.]|jgi:hypothetical protein|uniref:40S ribosomal protein S30 n=1 Tax=Diaphorobacter limosus TaxID=3036128 RepID=A0ABZ0J5F3_9BURK|nr:hypothetical protein [Diaphorobacter sp. Y-1]MBP6753240.1 hypothetical protein [Alicycliphilus sp.]MBP7326322.1 hypothetical protein [Alicycliphilus sp.]MBP7328130.1 hypothetical protein [Alicycliphilus sp.]MBP8780770.1 hypothetical protein [Alicycliphilus sp.]WOO33313.1 hypothetical protein P4826_04290 [Diaphorobacter sp. Y-1]
MGIKPGRSGRKSQTKSIAEFGRQAMAFLAAFTPKQQANTGTGRKKEKARKNKSKLQQPRRKQKIWVGRQRQASIGLDLDAWNFSRINKFQHFCGGICPLPCYPPPPCLVGLSFCYL